MPSKLNDQWALAKEIAERSKTETYTDMIKTGISKGAASMAPRAWKRRQKFKLYDWPYLSVCATLGVPDELFPDLCDQMNINQNTPIRQVRNRIVAYKKSLPDDEPIPIDRHDSDYIMLDGKRFWIPPALSQKIMKIVEDYLNDADFSN